MARKKPAGYVVVDTKTGKIMRGVAEEDFYDAEGYVDDPERQRVIEIRTAYPRKLKKKMKDVS